MAHNLNYNEEKDSWSFVINAGKEKKDVAWHGLGQVYDRPLTAIEALRGANADYTVQKYPIMKIRPEMADLEPEIAFSVTAENKDVIKSHVCTVREDTGEILGVVGKDYTVVQNSRAFDFVDVLCNGELGSGNPVIETAGVLGKGERVFVTARLPKNLYIGDTGDEVTDYILFTNSHDASGSVTALFTPVRVVCNNTLNVALKNCKNRISFKHTKSVTGKLDFTKEEQIRMVRTMMNVHDRYVRDLNDSLTMLSDSRVDERMTKDIVARAIFNDAEYELVTGNNMSAENVDEISGRKKNIYSGVLEAIDSGVGQESFRGSKLWIFNGFTTYFQNHRKWDMGSREKREKKFDSIMSGNANIMSQKVYDMLLSA